MTGDLIIIQTTYNCVLILIISDVFINIWINSVFLALFDIDRVVKERDITLLEQYIPIVIQYVLEDDQAVVLDSNFVKIFRISQLAIEYLQFCKKYLDNTVVLLKRELSKLNQVSLKIIFFWNYSHPHILGYNVIKWWIWFDIKFLKSI